MRDRLILLWLTGGLTRAAKASSRRYWMLLAVGLSSFLSDACGVEPAIWFERPATNWNEALPLGNGRLGAMVFGGIAREHLQLNEESLWAGCPVESAPAGFSNHLAVVRQLLFAGRNEEAQAYGLKWLTATPTSFRSYEPLADLWLDFGGSGDSGDYRRELLLSPGICRTRFRRGGIAITREAFISSRDDVLALRVSADRPRRLSFGIRLTRARGATITTAPGGYLQLSGQIVDVTKEQGGYEDNPGGSGPGGAHMKFAAKLLARVSGGTVVATNGELQVVGATEAVLLLTAATDYNLAAMNFDRSIQPEQICDRTLARASRRSWGELREAHVAEHRALFDRVSVQLGTHDAGEEALPTDARLAAVRSGGDDPGLMALHFQYGRYLLLGSSRRPARLPANLQGIWNDQLWAPWESDYHLNINLQMNYWPAGPANLAETVDQLVDWLEQLAQRGQRPARELYGARGWVSFLATNPFGRTTPSASTRESQFLNGVLDPLCGAWMAAQLFDVYQFTGDRAFLRRIYPILRGAAEFVLDSLVQRPDGALVIAPSTSPENSYLDPQTKKRLRITAGSTYHMTLVRAVFDATERAAAILQTDPRLREEIRMARAKLAPWKIGPDGRILEWAEPYQEVELGHRHMSHLLGLHPFDQITPATPDLYAAARKDLAVRLAHGGGGTGWSRAWMISFFARLQDGEAAREHYLALLRRSTLPNLFDSCPPFQIDGNFGGCAGLAEMLVQSHERATFDLAGQEFVVHLLPAVPKCWSSGSVRGLRTRGGFTVDFDWTKGRITNCRVRSEPPREVKVRLNNQVRTVRAE